MHEMIGTSIPERIRYLYENMPESAFLVFVDVDGGETSFSYREVIDRAFVWSRSFHDRGLGRGDRVVIIFPTSLDLHAAYLGALLGGMVPSMFAHPSPKLDEKEYMRTVDKLLENAAASCIVTYDTLSQRLKQFPQFVDLVTTVDEIRTEISGIKPDWSFQPHEEETAFLQYSSGTTGLKKGVAISHQALLWQVDSYAAAIQLERSSLIVSWLPLYHDMGLIACFFLPYLRGVRLVTMSPFDWVRNPVMLLNAVTRWQGTHVWLPNFAYSFLSKSVTELQLEEIDLSSLKGVVNCSEPVLAESHERFLETFERTGFNREALAASYALAENTFAATSGGFGAALSEVVVDGQRLARGGEVVPAEDGDENRRTLVSCGRPLPQTEVRIVNDNRHELRPDRVGEIALRSPCLLNEYFRNEPATRKAMSGGWYYTGDVGFMHDGELYVLGRKHDMLIVAGVNIYPQDIETKVNEIAGVYPGRCVAFGVEDHESGTQQLVVLAESAEDESTWDGIANRIREAIASTVEISPQDVRVLPHKWLKKSSSGKIARKANREKYLEDLLGEKATDRKIKDGSRVSDSEAVEITKRVRYAVHDVVKSHLGMSVRLPSDNAALFGGGYLDSFSLTLLLQRIESEFSVQIPVSVTADPKRFDTINRIAATVRVLRSGGETVWKESIRTTLPRMTCGTPVIPRTRNLKSLLWTFWLRMRGIRVGKGLKVVGRPLLRLEGESRNLKLGTNVTLMPGVDLKVREHGKIIIHDSVLLDSNVRLVAANDAELEVGAGSALAMGTIVNAGADVRIGRGTLIAAYGYIVASEHGIEGREPISQASYVHSPILIGSDVWLGGYVFVERGAIIGDGAVVGVHSTVTSSIPEYAVAMGNPARPVRTRSSKSKEAS
jgi:acyl-CoA synthetase (AMP-forming)/AMP-acid ligase II/acetyltransferase-like isoleucine patch superfamily enzyme/acyl carrier protein